MAKSTQLFFGNSEEELGI